MYREKLVMLSLGCNPVHFGRWGGATDVSKVRALNSEFLPYVDAYQLNYTASHPENPQPGMKLYSVIVSVAH
jgi:hypothetical protein